MQATLPGTKRKRKGKNMSERTAKECIETVRAIETLEYYNKNYLSVRYATNPGVASQLKIEILSEALAKIDEYLVFEPDKH